MHILAYNPPVLPYFNRIIIYRFSNGLSDTRHTHARTHTHKTVLNISYWLTSCATCFSVTLSFIIRHGSIQGPSSYYHIVRRRSLVRPRPINQNTTGLLDSPSDEQQVNSVGLPIRAPLRKLRVYSILIMLSNNFSTFLLPILTTWLQAANMITMEIMKNLTLFLLMLLNIGGY